MCIEQSQPQLPDIVKDLSLSHQTQITMMNTIVASEENSNGCYIGDDNNDDASHPGTLVLTEDVEHDIATFGGCCCVTSSSPSSRSMRGSIIFWCLAVVTVLIIAAGTLTAVMLRMSMNTTGTANTAQSSPNIPRTESYYQERYKIFYQTLMNTFEKEGSSSLSTLLTTPDTPQYQAFHWMVYDDTTIVSHASDTTSTSITIAQEPSSETPLIQRYTIMVLYYACGGEAWQISSASSTSTTAENIEGLGHIDTCAWGTSLNDPDFIVCDTTTEEIVTLQLDQKRLIGQLPNELFVLSSLVTLDASYNFLKGTIPSTMFNQMIHLRT